MKMMRPANSLISAIAAFTDLVVQPGQVQELGRTKSQYELQRRRAHKAHAPFSRRLGRYKKDAEGKRMQLHATRGWKYT